MLIRGLLERPDLRSLRHHPRRTVGHLYERLRRSYRPVTEGGRICHATIEATFRCNLRCPMCSQWGRDGLGLKMLRGEVDSGRLKDPMTLTEIQHLVDQLLPHRSQVLLTGGELFTRRDAIDLIEYVSQAGLSTGIVTNGTLLDGPLIRRMAQARRLEVVTFSVDGSEEFHDRIRGKGNFRRTITAATTLAASWRDERDPRGFPLAVRVNTTLLPSNFESVRELVGELRAAGVDQVNLSHPRWLTMAEADRHHRMLFEDFGLDDRGVYSEIGRPFPEGYADELYATIAGVRQEFGSYVTSTPPEMTLEQMRRYYTDLTFIWHPRCNQPYRAIRVRADGNVIFCPDQWVSGYFIRNVKETPVEESWQSPRARAFRGALNQHGLWPGCARCCITNRDDS